MTEAEWLASLMAKERVRCDPDTECWVWLGATNKWGYGRLTAQKKWWPAHRYAYAHFVGEIPDGQMVLHRCDNPPCVNPSHLFLGTHETNMRDMADKGRWNGAVLLGEANGRAKLTAQLVRRARLLAGQIGARPAARTISGDTGLSGDTLRGAIRRKTWRHL